MSRELVERLRLFDNPFSSVDVDLSEAADLIERQRKIIEGICSAWFDYDVFPTKTNREKLEAYIERARFLANKDTEE